MRARKKKKMLWTFAVIMVIAAVLSIWFTRRIPVKKLYKSGEILLEDTEKTAKVSDGYANETSYSGSSYVPASVFSFPFKKTESYINNKEYINDIGAEEAGVLSDRIAKALEEIYNINYETIDHETYKGVFDEYASYGVGCINTSTGDYYEGSEDIADMIINFAKDTELVMELKAYSDRSLVYYDEQSDIVRVKVIGAIYNCKNIKKVEDFLGVDSIEIGTPFSMIIDVYTNANFVMDDHSSFVIQRTSKIM